MLLSAVKQQQRDGERWAVLGHGPTAEFGDRGTVSPPTQVESTSVLLLSKNQKHLHNYSNQQHETESEEKATKERSCEKGQLV